MQFANAGKEIMNISLSHTALRLAAHETFSVIDGRGARIACRQGRIWITQDQDTRDVLLEAGENFILDRDGAAIVEALVPADVAVDAPGSGRSPRQTALAVLGIDRRPAGSGPLRTVVRTH